MSDDGDDLECDGTPRLTHDEWLAVATLVKRARQERDAEKDDG